MQSHEQNQALELNADVAEASSSTTGQHSIERPSETQAVEKSAEPPKSAATAEGELKRSSVSASSKTTSSGHQTGSSNSTNGKSSHNSVSRPSAKRDLYNFWLTGKGIHSDVLQREICSYLGPDAFWEPATYNVCFPDTRIRWNL